MTKAFTPASVQAIKPPQSGRSEILDGSIKGFGIRVTAAGSKSWQITYRREGKLRRIIIGQVPADYRNVGPHEMTLAAARAEAADLRAQIEVGADPAAERQAVKRQAATERADTSRTFRALWDVYYKRHASTLARGEEMQQIVDREVLSDWADRRVDELTRFDVADLCGKVADDGRPGAAKRLFDLLRGFFNYVVKHALVRGMDSAPTDRMAAPVKPVSRDRTLSDDEIKVAWGAFDVLEQPFGGLFKILLLTGQRRNETARMKRTDLDLEAGAWTIPAGDAKTSAEHVVYLSDLAIEIIESQPRVSWSEYVFAGRGANPVSGFSKSKARADELSGVTDWRLHDLRRTCRSGMARLGVPVIVAERVLNHEIGGLISIYDRHGYAEEMKQAWQRWGAHVAGLVRPKSDKVVQIREAV